MRRQQQLLLPNSCFISTVTCGQLDLSLAFYYTMSFRSDPCAQVGAVKQWYLTSHKFVLKIPVPRVYFM